MPATRLSDAEWEAIRDRVLGGESMAAIAREYGLHTSNVSGMLRRRFNVRANPYWSPTVSLPDDPGVLGYLAGIIDGEGSIFPLQGERSWIIKVGMTDHDVIHWIGSFGGKINFNPRENERYKDSWTWFLSRRTDITLFLTAILPYMHVKRARAEECLTALAAMAPSRQEVEKQMRDSRKTHTEYVSRGESHWKAKVTDAQVLEIRRHAANRTATYTEMAAAYGTSVGQIGRIARGESRKDV